MFRIIPKHKRAKKLQSELKRKISRAKEELEGNKAGGKKEGPSYRVAREGAGQVVLVGPPNSGKSALLAALSNAKPDVAAYPFTTRVPRPGMMLWNDTRVHVVDLPPITPDVMEPWLPGLVRAADAALLVVDLSTDDAADAAEAVLTRLADAHAPLVAALPHDQAEETIIPVRTALVANKSDAPGVSGRLEVFREWFGDRFTMLEVSAMTGMGLDRLRPLAYHLLDVMRIYTKVIRRSVDRTYPFTIPSGGTVLDLARGASRFRARAEVRQGLGCRCFRRADRQTRPRAARHGHRGTARLSPEGDVGAKGVRDGHGLDHRG